MKIGLITSDYKNLDKYENSEIIKYIKQYFDEYTVFDLFKIEISISDKIEVSYYNNNIKYNLDSYDVILIRKTRGYVEQILDIITALEAIPSPPLILDMPESFDKPTSKINPLVNRNKYFLQPTTNIILNIEIEIETLGLNFPVICKPSHGTGGKNINICNDLREVNSYRRSYLNSILLDNESTLGYGLIIQEYITFDEEYRVNVINGRSIGSVVKKSNSKIKNANLGGTFEKKENLEVIELAEKVSKFQKLFFAGVDIIRKDNKYYILECNRNPAFKEFDRATESNTAKKLIQEIYKQLK